MSDPRKQTLWHTIDWYASSIGTEHEKRERAVLDQAIDAALADSAPETCSTCGERYGTKAGEYCADTFHCGTKWTPTTDAPPEVKCLICGRSRSQHERGVICPPATADAPPTEPTEEMVETMARYRWERRYDKPWEKLQPELRLAECNTARKDLCAALTAQKEGK